MSQSNFSLLEHLKAQIKAEFLRDGSSFPYKRAKRQFVWGSSFRNRVVKITEDYEQRLRDCITINAVSHDHHNNRTIVIRGGRGSGKTTAILKSLHDLKKEIEIDFIYLDMNEWDQRNILNEKAEVVRDRFVSHLASRIRSYFPISEGKRFGYEEQVFEFLPWCIENTTEVHEMRKHIPPLERFLTAREEHIIRNRDRESLGSLSPADLTTLLFDDLARFYEELTDYDSIWLNFLILIFLNGWEPGRENLSRRHLVLDNLDHLDPDLQNYALELIHTVTRCSGIQTIVPMRPHTFSANRSSVGHDWFEVQEHCSPDVIEVIQKRLHKLANKRNKKSEKDFVNKLNSAVTNDLKHFRSIIELTSALDIRTGLLNFSNFCERYVKKYGESTDFSDKDMSEISKLFFLNSSGHIDANFIENLYFIKFPERFEYSIAKPLILSVLLESGIERIQFGELREFMLACGISEVMIYGALSDLLRRSRALLWSTKGFSPADFDDEVEISATPLAASYYYELMGEYFYVEVCLADFLEHDPSVNEVIAFEKRMLGIELIATSAQRLSQTPLGKRYLEVFEGRAISLEHWHRFLNGAKFRMKRDPENLLDHRRENFIRDRIKQARVSPTA